MDGPETAEPPSAEPAQPSRRVAQDGLPNDRSISIEDPSSLIGSDDLCWLRDHLLMAIEHLGLGGEVRIRLVDDRIMSREHERTLGDPSTTDVLTFDLRAGATGPLDTDVLVCVDEARRRSEDLGHAIREELLLYAIHAVLHCADHDDRDEASAEAMHAREDEILEAIGVGARYSERRP